MARSGVQPAIGRGFQLTWRQVERARDWLVSYEQRQGIYGLLVAVILLLLITCANLASLQIDRGLQRQSEQGMRLALGAGAGARGGLRLPAAAEPRDFRLHSQAGGRRSVKEEHYRFDVDSRVCQCP